MGVYLGRQEMDSLHLLQTVKGSHLRRQPRAKSLALRGGDNLNLWADQAHSVCFGLFSLF